MVVENDTAESCEYFIPHIDIEDEDIEVEIIVNVTHKCPYCGNKLYVISQLFARKFG